MKKALFKTEDWWAVWIGLFIFILSLGPLAGIDLLGWAAKVNIWTDLSKAVRPVSKTFALSGWASLILTFLALLAVLSVGAKAIGLQLRKFICGFTVIFSIAVISMVAGHYANIAVNAPADFSKYNISWSMKLSGESGLIIALLIGLIISNFAPKLKEFLSEAARPEWYIKTAIVILGAAIGVKFVGALGLAQAVLFRGLSAVIEAYLIYWALVYFMARKYFKFSPEWAAPLASGISICGVSASIATGAAIRARPIVPIMVSSLVVIFAVVELLILPFIAQTFLYNEPLVAGAWMGLAVKTDGAAVASGQIADSLIAAKSLAVTGIKYESGWILSTATTVKLFIDIFIGIWAFILAIIWSTKIDRHRGERVRIKEIWDRFPKFIIGYAVTFGIMLTIGLYGKDFLAQAKVGSGQADLFRTLFFALTFLSIGLITDFRKLWEEGIGRLALVYVIALFGYIIWIGFAISWIFFHGVKPPQVG